jgi:CBS domain-containing protein
MPTNKIRDLLKTMGERPIISIGPDEMVFEAVTRMADNNIGAILVLEGDNICGIMSERDYLRFITAKGRTARDTPVHELMTRKVIYATPDTPVPEVMAIMTEKRIRHVPIMEGDKLLGIVSIGDVVKRISQDQTAKIQVLEEYISDSYPGPARDTT